ncbi:AraC family transcriptional regulator [Niabella drilacis]|uniref:AraC-like ligand binding domain-containing protein n=1 Tax=Niabella drilacis (strain DSM 25811 / CCM 8410 / CCUG 62505 / LMG 26954 / E90) TaxID=1285928 RepID=A0A1G6RJL4_NIADE|nr:AraC family transcriptional regulator [Niabella drilacis]SDD04564.1 AraC-like ligand binding domain-containing protein [Niabella drilacis]
MIRNFKLKDGFSGELQINVPREIVINHLRKRQFLGNLFITHIGFFPKARFHFRERPFGCADNILVYCVDGKGHYRSKTAEHTLLPEHFFILPPGESHMYQADIRTPWTIYWLHFSGNMLKAFNHLIKVDDFTTPTKIKKDKRIIEQWSDIYSVLSTGFSDQNLTYATLCLYKLLTFFVCPIDIYTPVIKKDPINDSIAYMKAHIDQQLTVQELAGKQQLSGSHYMMLFKNKTGSSPIDYFIRLKMQYACQLLMQSGFKIGDIAAKIGYYDVFYFSRLFKKTTGYSPSEYRERVCTN